MNPGEAIAAVVVFGSMGFIGITLAKAFAQRISGGATSPREVEALRDEVAQLRSEVDDLHQRLGDVDEIQNRLEFTERVVAQLKSRPALPGGG
jgi:divalent metal cation (Fe/Co/Zn/Cd) transporter